MNSNLKQAYEIISELLYDSQKTIYFFRKNNYDNALRTAKIILGKIGVLLEDVMSHQTRLTDYIISSQHEMNAMLSDLMTAQQEQDYILLADLYELQILNWLRNMQELIIAEETCDLDQDKYQRNKEALKENYPDLVSQIDLCEDEALLEAGYELEFTTAGEVTLSRVVDGKRFYFHSNVSPRWEGFLLAESWNDTEKSHAYVYGLGLGYAVLELLRQNRFLNVTVLESSREVMNLALHANDFSEYILNGRLHFVYDPAFALIGEQLKEIDEDAYFVVHAPSMRNISDIKIRDSIGDYFLQYNSQKLQYSQLIGNFRKNIKRNDPSIDSERDKIKGQTVYIVAAGPSLDNNFMLLKEKKDGLIIATGTVFKKLLEAGIEPDFVIMSDASERVYGQIKGLQDRTTPMIYLSTANYLFARDYKGQKYIALQKDFPEAEKVAKEKGYELFETGGSVTTTALDICLRLGCKKVVFLGLDLAYPGGLVHASNTSRRKLADDDQLRVIKDIYGNDVKTNRSLTLFRKWIENRIRQTKDVEFIDATEGGARIEGTKILPLQEVIQGK